MCLFLQQVMEARTQYKGWVGYSLIFGYGQLYMVVLREHTLDNITIVVASIKDLP